MEFTMFVGLLTIALLTVIIGIPVGKFIDRKISEIYPTRMERKIDAMLGSVQTVHTDMHRMTKAMEPMWKEMANLTKEMKGLIPKDL